MDFSRNGQSDKDEAESFKFSEEDWEQLNKIIGYKEGEEGEGQSFISTDKMDSLHTFLEVHMKHNASKLLDEALDCLAELSCEDLDCTIKLYPETKVFDVKLGSYKLSSPNGLLTEVWIPPPPSPFPLYLRLSNRGAVFFVVPWWMFSHLLAECYCLWFVSWGVLL